MGIATIYGVRGDWTDRPLYCDRTGDLLYNVQTLDTTPWVALDVRLYEQGFVQCGDRVLIELENGTTIAAFALDAGSFEGHLFLERPVVVDVPAILLDRLNIPYWGVKPGTITIRPNEKEGLVIVRGKRMDSEEENRVAKKKHERQTTTRK